MGPPLRVFNFLQIFSLRRKAAEMLHMQGGPMVWVHEPFYGVGIGQQTGRPIGWPPNPPSVDDSTHIGYERHQLDTEQASAPISAWGMVAVTI